MSDKYILVMKIDIPMLISQKTILHTFDDEHALVRLKQKLIEVVKSELKHSLDYRKARIDDSIALAKYLHNKTEKDIYDEISRVEASHKEVLQLLEDCVLTIGRQSFDVVLVSIRRCELV